MPPPEGTGGLQFNIQSGPEYQRGAHENLLKLISEIMRRPYEPRIKAEEREELRKKIIPLQEIMKGPKEAIIPFSVTGLSKPVSFSPFELESISKNPDIARKLFAESTGIERVTEENIKDIQKRAQEKLIENKELIQKYEKEGIPTQITQPNIPKEKQQQFEKAKKYLSEINNLKGMYAETPQGGSLLTPFPPYHEPISEESPLGKLARSRGSNQIKTEEIQKIKKDLEKEIEELTPKVTQSIPFTSSSQLDLDQLMKRVGAQRQIEKLSAPHQLLAPMTERHKQAIGMLERSFDDDTLKLAAEELTKAQKFNTLEKVQPFVNEALESPDAYTDKYVKNYRDNVIQALRDESERSLLEDIIPKIENRYISKGAYHSGARQGTIGRAIEANSRSLNNEIRKLLSHAHDKAMEHHQAEKSRKLGAAQVIGGASQQERENLSKGAEQLRTLGLTRHGLTHSNVGALSQVARAEQEQLQNQLNLEAQEVEKAKQHDIENLKLAHHMISGLPVTTTQSIGGSHVSTNPPNLYNIAGGLVGTLAGLNQPQTQQQPRTYSKGGLVRKRYADGGDVNSSSFEDQMRNLLLQREMDYNRQLQEARQPPTLSAFMSNIGQAMLSNPRGNPIENAAKGISSTMEGMASSKQREANLMDKINDSRMQQYKILADFESRKAEREHKENILNETNRRHKESLDQSARHHHENLAAKYAKIDSSGGVETKESIKARIKRNTEIRDEMENLLKTSEEGLRITKGLEAVSNRTDTGPVSGVLYHIPGAGPYLHEKLGFGSREDIQQLQGLATEGALAEERTFPAKAQSVALLNAMLKTKPNEYLLKKENIRRSGKKTEKFLEGVNKAKFIIDYVDNGYGDETAALKEYNQLRKNEKSKGRKISLPEEESEGEQKEEHISSSKPFNWSKYPVTPITE